MKPNLSGDFCSCKTMDRLIDAELAVSLPNGQLAFRLESNIALLIRYCCACGKMLRVSKTTIEQIDPDEQEMNSVTAILSAMKTIEEVVRAFGKPDEVHSGDGIVFNPGEIQFRNQIVYRKRWSSFDLVVFDLSNDTIRALFSPKVVVNDN